MTSMPLAVAMRPLFVKTAAALKPVGHRCPEAALTLHQGVLRKHVRGGSGHINSSDPLASDEFAARCHGDVAPYTTAINGKHHGGIRSRLHGACQLIPLSNRHSVNRCHRVANLQSGPLGRATSDDAPDHRGLVEAQPPAGQAVADPVGRQRRLRRALQQERAFDAAIVNDERQFVVEDMRQQLPADVPPMRDITIVDTGNAHATANTSRMRRGACIRRRHDRLQIAIRRSQGRRVQGKSQHEIRQRASGDYHRTLPQRLPVEGVRYVRDAGRDFRIAGVEHAHVAAERQGRHRKLGAREYPASSGPPKQHRPKADREAEHAHATPARRQIVT